MLRNKLKLKLKYEVNPRFESRINIQVQTQNEKHENEELNSKYTQYQKLFVENILPLISKKKLEERGQSPLFPPVSDGPAIYGINSLSKDSNQCSLKRKRKKKVKRDWFGYFFVCRQLIIFFFSLFLNLIQQIVYESWQEEKEFFRPSSYCIT